MKNLCKGLAVLCVVILAVPVARAADVVVPNFNKRGDNEKKFVERVGEIIVQKAHKSVKDTSVKSYKFTDEKIKQAATQFVERYRNSRSNSLGHNVGMEVHDVRNPTPTLEPGQVFTIEPAMQIAGEHVGIRLEDMILITETGYENLSSFAPVEIADIEKMMTRHGLSDAQVKLK